MLKEVIEFNKARNGFKYDPQLECDMFEEEVQEFFDAKNIAERVDALLDCMFVKLGTMCKLSYNGFDAEVLPYPHKTVIDMMTNVVQTELGENYLRVIKEGERIVCECNKTKLALKTEGKVKKTGMTRNATKEIASLIEAILKEKKD